MNNILEPVLSKEIVLSEEQQYLAEQIDKWLNIPSPGSFLLDARAGVGKTTTIAETLRNKPLFLAAPTHRAVNEFVKRMPGCRDYSTVHALLSAQPAVNDDTGELEFITGNGKEIPQNTILVIDEASMLSTHHVNKIESLYKDYKRIYLGDSNQLPPVKEAKSSIFEQTHQKTGSLTKIERYSGEILDYALGILNDQFEAPEGLVSRQMARRWKETLRAGVECKMLAYTNRAVDAWNLEARETINGRAAVEEDDWIEGDPIILKAPIKSDEPNEPTRYHTNEPAIAYNIRPSQHTLGRTTFPIYTASLHFPEMSEHIHNVRLMSQQIEDGFERYKKNILDKIAKGEIENPRKSWAKYYQEIEKFAQVKHAYSSTVHAVQGATIEHVFVDTKNINICKNRDMKKALLYTAITRSKTSLMVNG